MAVLDHDTTLILQHQKKSSNLALWDFIPIDHIVDKPSDSLFFRA